MMRRLLVTTSLVAALAVVLGGPAGASSASSPRIVESGSGQFPDMAYILTLPAGSALRPGSVHVTENGAPVADVQVISAGSAEPGLFGVVLTLDASKSMKGRAIFGAVDAARAFAARRPDAQQLALVTFNKAPHIALPFTADTKQIDGALAAPPTLVYGTHIYDAVWNGLSLIRASRLSAGSIVVLSDGADTGSAHTAAAVEKQARAQHVRVFTIGLRSRAFTPAALRELAHATGGEYSEASDPSQLKAIFDSLGARLSREYLVRYKSLAGPGKKIHVQIRVDGFSGASRTGYVTPALPLKRTPPFNPSFGYRFWRSAGAMVLISFAVAALLGLLVIILLRPRPRTFRRRLAEFVSLHLTDVARKPGSLTDGVLQGAERSLEKTRWWARFNEELEIAQIRIPAIQIVFLTAIATLAFGWIVAAVSGVGLFAVLGLAVPLAVRSVLQRKLRQRRAAFGEQLPDNLQMLSSALRAGHSLVGGLSVVVEDAEEPAKTEFRRVIADEQLGVPLEDALERVVRRMANDDLEQVALVAALHRETGGNTAEVLDRVTDVVRGRRELRERVRVLTAQGRLSRWVVTALPVCLAGILTLLNPHYMGPLFTHRLGQVLVVLAVIMVTTGSLLIKRIVDIKV